MVIQNIIIRNAYDIQITIIREYIIRVYTTKKIRVYIIRVYEKMHRTIPWAYDIQITILQKN